MPRDKELDDYLARARGLAQTTGAEAVLGAVAAALGAHRAVELGRRHPPLTEGTRGTLVPPERLARPELLGAVYEALRSRPSRRPSGAFYTPETLTRPLVAAVLHGLATPPAHVRVCDPAMGGGAFLLAAARHLIGRGADPGAVVRGCVFGVDVDPLAVAVTRAALSILGGGAQPPAEHLAVADALLADGALPDQVDAVVGNPPFLSQLSASTARAADYRAALRRRFGPAAGGYADTANVFLLLALRLARHGGRVGLVLPDSFLVARDAAPTRKAATGVAALEWLWLAGEELFDAGVRVCAPVFALGRPQSEVARRVGASFAERAPLRPARPLGAPSWSGLVADLLGVPPVACAGQGALGDHCRATADFRDEYYGLVPYVFDEDEGRSDDARYPRLMTSGLIDPGRSLWGLRTTRFAKRTFARPRVDAPRLRRDSPLAGWSARRQVPKILLATQTRVLEAAVDEAGAWLPCTPTITVEAPPGRLWHVGAALNSPPLSALALHGCAGAALSPDAIKLRAADVVALPAPRPGRDWDAGARALRAAAEAAREHERLGALEAAGRALCRAYRVEEPEPLLRWWLDRLPRRTEAAASPSSG